MPLHSYSSLIRRIDQRATPLGPRPARFPMTLVGMHDQVPTADIIMRTVEGMTSRTGWCYHSFLDPLIANRLQMGSAELLKWVKTITLREFKYCVALEEISERYVKEGRHGFAGHSYNGSSATYIRNTDDWSYLDDSLNARTTLSPSSATLGVGGSSVCSREDAEHSLSVGSMELTDLPFELALEILRPEESVLDILVNEASFRSDKLNAWFSRFCRSRVAWRVLHEHLMHLIAPHSHPVVVRSDNTPLSILQETGSVVANIYAKLNVNANELTICVEEDPELLTSTPQERLLTSSSSGAAPLCPAPPVCSTIYSAEGHLAYVFRELLKNSCVATMRWSQDVSVTVKYAVGDRWVVVDFIDHAGGIPEKHTKDIWRFGWTSSDHYESHLGGFGVGLPTSKVYMDLWGGSIDIYSTEGKGTTTRVRFPKSPTEVLLTLKGAGAVAPPAG